MARPFVEIKVGNKGLNAILDLHSALLREPAPRLSLKNAIKDTEGREYCFSGIFFPVEDLGAENGKRVDVLVGSLLLEDWGAVIDDSKAPPAVD